MKHQQGAALVIVMGLLSAALLIGVASMQSALVDERLAGNFRAYVQTQMVEESLLVAATGHRHAAQRDALFTQLTQSLSIGDRYRLSSQQLATLVGENTLAALSSHLPFHETDEGTPPTASLAIDVKKLDGKRMAVTLSRDDQAGIQPLLVFAQAEAEPYWRLDGFH